MRVSKNKLFFKYFIRQVSTNEVYNILVIIVDSVRPVLRYHENSYFQKF